MYGYAIRDSETDWVRTNPATQCPLVYWDLKTLKAVRDKLMKAGVPSQRVQPVELLGAARAIQPIELDALADGYMG
jgi:hypothetical protein